jgi:NAD(P)-dependent dehydrogenase (short-subunit alcohol dehydrogenase family)
MRFKDKVVVVLGGNSGIGLASAIAFAKEGGKLVITGRNAETLESATEEIGPNTIALQSDISDLKALDNVMSLVRDAHGRIDVLFVNAGVGGFRPVEQVDAEFWEHMIGVNLRGPYFAVQKALPLLKPGSSIVLTSSLGHAKGLPGNSVYAATKAGLRALARNFGAEFVDRGIRVNCFSPGPIDTPIIERSGLTPEQIPVLREKITEDVPMKRFGTPEEAAKAVLFLASDDASYITGIDLFVDGGASSF